MKKGTEKIIMIAAMTALFILVGPFCREARVSAGTVYNGASWEYYIPGSFRVLDDDHTMIQKEVRISIEAATNGVPRTSMTEWRVLPFCADVIWFGEPGVGGCDQCKALAQGLDLFSTRIFLEDDSGREYYSKSGYTLTKQDCAAAGVDLETISSPIRIGLEITQRPGPQCPSCGAHVGDSVIVNGLFWKMRTISIVSQPNSVYVNPGENASFRVVVGLYRNSLNDPMNYFKWQRYVDGAWENIGDGGGRWGESYLGSDSATLTVTNISQSMRGMPLRCEMKGELGTRVYSDTVYINMPEPTSPPVTAAPTPPPITPHPGGGNTGYTPSASSSSYVPPAPVTPGVSGGGKPASSSSSSSSKGNDSYSGKLDGGSSSSTKITAPEGPAAPTTGQRGSSAGRSSSAKGSSAGKTSSSSSTSRTGPAGGNYVMRNGVLYVIDDENPDVGTENTVPETGSVENVETEMAYELSDLATLGQMNEKELEKGFFSTVPGIITIACISLLVLLILLFFLFFGVMVFGEVEEHDEVFEICAVRLMRRREGNWYVRLGNAFDDNAVLKLRIGLLFAVIFEGWDLVGEASGSYEGTVSGVVEQGMLLYRKSVRRTV